MAFDISKRTAYCKAYYERWIVGETEEQISSNLKSTFNLKQKDFNLLLPAFVAYCRHAAAADTRKNLIDGLPPVTVPLTDELREKFISYVQTGLPYPKVSRLMGIPLPTVMEVWFIDDPTFKDECEMAAEKADADVELALHKRAVGYTYRSVQKFKSQQLNMGEIVDLESTNTSTKNVAADVKAIELYLINRKSNSWTRDGMTNREGSKGQILEALAAMNSEENPPVTVVG